MGELTGVVLDAERGALVEPRRDEVRMAAATTATTDARGLWPAARPQEARDKSSGDQRYRTGPVTPNTEHYRNKPQAIAF